MEREVNKRGIFFIISAPSGAGKTTMCREIMKIFPEIRLSVSYTTRKKRAGETDGKDYHFTDKREFQRMIKDGAFAEWAKVHNEYYGTTVETIMDSASRGFDQILDIDWQGAKQLKQNLDEGVYIFVLPPSIAELEARIRKRGGDSDEAIRIRLDNASEEMRQAKWYDYNIVNDNLDEALFQLKSVVVAERCRTRPRNKPVP